MAGAFQFEQYVPAGHVAPLAIGPPPVPVLAKLTRQLRSAPLGVLGLQALDERKCLIEGDLGAK